MSEFHGQYLGSRPKLTESRHLSLFLSLSRVEAQRTLLRMEQDMVIPRTVGMPPNLDGRSLFEICLERDLDHAAVVFPLCRETDEIGLGALQTLVGKPVRPWAPRQHYASLAPRERSASGHVPQFASGGFRPDQVVVSVAPNPKKAGSATWHRYKHWVPGDTVAACMARGLTRADVVWDIDPGRRFVVLGTAEEAAARREVESG